VVRLGSAKPSTMVRIHPETSSNHHILINMLTRKTKYAIKSLLYIAQKDEIITTVELCKKEGIPKKFLECILLDLKNHGILISKKGKEGGYRLAKRPEEITFGQIFRIFEGTIASVECVSTHSYNKCQDCIDEETCQIKKVMKKLRDESAKILDGTTLNGMLNSRENIF
jgi:Rrf2 family protein